MTYIFVCLFAYAIIMGTFAYIGFKKTKSTSDYFLAGKQMHPVVMALSYGATFISTSAIVGFGGAAGQYGMGLIWLTALTIVVGVFIAFVVFGKKPGRLDTGLEPTPCPSFLLNATAANLCRAIPEF